MAVPEHPALSGAAPGGSRTRTPSTSTGGSPGPAAADGASSVEATFERFCRARRTQPREAAIHGEERQLMDCRTFAQLCRDCHLLGQHLRSADADLIFATAAGKGHRGLDLRRFEAALRLVAEKKGVHVASVLEAVARSEGPVLHGTVAQSVRFYDGGAPPKSKEPKPRGLPPVLWRTGSWAESRKMVDHVSAWIADLPDDEGERSDTLDRYVWGRARSRSAVMETGLRRSRSGLLSGESSPSSPFEDVVHAHRVAKKVTRRARDAADPVVRIFREFCGEHGSFMDVDAFEQLCRRCFIIDGKFTGIDARGVFASVVSFGQKFIDRNEFSDALEVIAKRKGQQVEGLRASVALCVSPKKKVAAIDLDAPADPPNKEANYRVGGHRLPKLGKNV